MLRSNTKKTPMYVSTTSTNANETSSSTTYQFQDFTSSAPNSPTLPFKDATLIRKIETLYKSQLLDIEQSNQEHAVVEEPISKEIVEYEDEGKFGNILQQNKNNNYQPFQSVKRLQTCKTVAEYDEEDCESLVCTPTSEFGHIFNFHNSQKAFVKTLQGSKSTYINSSSKSDFTSDELIDIMPEPFRSNIGFIKKRAQRSMKIL